MSKKIEWKKSEIDIDKLNNLTHKQLVSSINASNLSLNPKFKEWASKGGKIGINNLLKWCEENNHWDTIRDIHKDIPKSEEHKKKISNTLKGRPIAEETKQKMSKSRMGHGWSDEALNNIKKSARKRCKAVNQFDLDGNFIKEWKGFAYIVEELNLEKSGIYLCCNGKIKKSQGFIWKYKD